MSIIQLNNNPVDWHEGMTVAELIKIMKFTFPMLVVKVDGKIIDTLTHDMITKGSWKNQSFRRYDVEINVPASCIFHHPSPVIDFFVD